jgi:uncharacterized protein
MMIQRQFWHNLIQQAWHKRSIIWLTGVRRVGKTQLCRSLSNIEYFDCELPRVRHYCEEVESFLQNYQNKTIVLDEIHRLDNPSELLKIAADHYPSIRIIATGSSTLGASTKFSDTLTGRKTTIWLTPLLCEEMQAFGYPTLNHRLLHGGLPPFFMSHQFPECDFVEWIDAYWARDIQALFHLEKRYSFQKFTELVLAQSGGIFEASQFSAPCEVARQTISNYLSILETTHVAHVIRPFTSYRSTEIVSAPKVYGFDTGFVCYAKGWYQLRQEDYGLLWEHIVLNQLHAHLQTRDIHYWRNKQKQEIDFVLINKRNKSIITIECKWLSKKCSTNNLKTFRSLYPQGENFIVSSDIDQSFVRKVGEITVEFVNVYQLIEKLKNL